MKLEELMEICRQGEENSRQIADSFIKKVEANQYPVIEMREKLARKIVDERQNETADDDSVLKESDFDYDEMLGDEFVIKLTKFGWAVEYIHVQLSEENGRQTISELTVMGNHLPCELEPDDDNMRYLLSIKPSVDTRDYSNVDLQVMNAQIAACNIHGYEVPKEDMDQYLDCATLYFIDTVLILSYFSEKCRNQKKLVANNASCQKNTTQMKSNGISSNATNSNVVKIEDFTIVYPNDGKGERAFTRHTDSWLVRGHLRHYKSGKVVSIKPYVKGDRSVPVRNKIYRVV